MSPNPAEPGSSFNLRIAAIKNVQTEGAGRSSRLSQSAARWARSGSILGVCGAVLFALSLSSCDRNLISGSKLTPANYDQVSIGMSKAEVEKILGPPTSIETKDVLIYKKTTYRYEDGKKFAMITFKNDEVDGKDTNLGREP